jgi:hypothetical protein
MTYDFGLSNSITVQKPDVNLFWKTFALDFKIQLSKSILIVTPYLGLGATYAWSEAGYEAKAPVSGNTNLAQVGGMDITDNKISSTIEVNGFSARAFGGLSFNIMVLKLDLTGLYNFRDSNYGASLGARFQL